MMNLEQDVEAQELVLDAYDDVESASKAWKNEGSQCTGQDSSNRE